MNYLSVCSGIEAASVAWHPLGWQPFAFAEVDAFPSAVLAHRFPGVPNLGDMTKFREWPDASVSVLVGGTPCQSFSVAGLRAGLADPRGNLALVYLAIAERYRPTWLLWENVPGVLSSNSGRDFGAFLGGLGELGYGFAYRVLDAQYVRVDGFPRAVPQRRRRVFVVGHFGDWRPAAAVLFERESLSGHSPPRREAGAGIAAGTLGGTGPGSGWRIGPDEAAAGQLVAFGGNNTAGPIDVATACNAHAGGRLDFESETFVVPKKTWPASVALTLNAHYGDKYGHENQHIDEGGPLFVPVPFDTTLITSAANRSNPQPGDPCHPLAAGAHAPAVAFNWQSGGDCRGLLPSDVPSALTKEQTPATLLAGSVRRLTPTECERLQGFPDGWTAIPYRGKPATDAPRYKALGNSMAVNVMRWLGCRIDLVDKALSSIGRAAA